MKVPIVTSKLALVGLAVVVAVLIAVQPDSSNPKTVNIQYNGFSYAVATNACDVSELLVENFGEYDGLDASPSPETKIVGGETIIVTDSINSRLNPVVAANLNKAIEKYEESLKQAEPKSPTYTGLATWYSFGDGMNTASRDFPKGATLRVIAVNSGKTIDVIVNDYGPQAWTGVALDLNKPAFAKLAPLGAGKIQIQYFQI